MVINMCGSLDVAHEASRSGHSKRLSHKLPPTHPVDEVVAGNDPTQLLLQGLHVWEHI